MPLFQSESKCATILITLICMKMTELHAELIIKGFQFAIRLVLKQRPKRTRKWPCELFEIAMNTL